MTSRRELISRGIGLMAVTAVTRSFVAQSVVGQAKFVASPVDPMQLVNPQFRAALQSIVGPDSPPAEWTTAMLPQMRESKGLVRPLLPAPGSCQTNDSWTKRRARSPAVYNGCRSRSFQAGGAAYPRWRIYRRICGR